MVYFKKGQKFLSEPGFRGIKGLRGCTLAILSTSELF
jgi:hypothetical protein